MLPPLPSTARRLDKGVASDHVGVDGNIVSRYTWLSWQKPNQIVLQNWWHTCSPSLWLWRINCEYPAWKYHDQAYYDKAAATSNKKWSQIDPALFNQIPGAQKCRAVQNCSEVASLRAPIHSNQMTNPETVAANWGYHLPLIQQRQLDIHTLQVPPHVFPKKLRRAPPCFFVPWSWPHNQSRGTVMLPENTRS